MDTKREVTNRESTRHKLKHESPLLLFMCIMVSESALLMRVRRQAPAPFFSPPLLPPSDPNAKFFASQPVAHRKGRATDWKTEEKEILHAADEQKVEGE